MATATNGDDVLEGTSRADTIDGLGGNDTIITKQGNDTLIGGAGDDSLQGGGGVDTAVFGGLSATYTIIFDGISTYTVTGADGTDTLRSIEQLRFDDGTFNINDVVSPIITGTARGERLTGTDNDDIISGLGGPDQLVGFGGDDELNGGDGDDTLDGDGGNDELNGDDGDDTLNAGPGDDELNGGDGNDALDGQGNDDELNGGEGSDTLDGGAGVDIAVFAGLRSSYFLVRNAIGDYEMIGPDGRDVLRGIEFARFDDGTFAIRDIDSNIINGSNSSDRLVGNGANNTLNGFGDNDNLRGEGGADTLNGGAGNDFMNGGNGRDTAVFSGSSEDYFVGLNDFGSIGGYIVIGPDGNDIIQDVELLRFDNGTFAVDDLALSIINGTTNSEFIRGTNTDELIFTGDGNDRIEARRGDDYVDGGDGFDTLLVRGRESSYSVTDNQDGSYMISGPDGTDLLIDIEAIQFGSDARLISSLVDTVEGVLVDGTAGNETLFGFELDDRLNGFGGDDTLRGRFGDDELNGGAGEDQLIGGIGFDFLEGGAGNDALFGGRGNDTAVYSGDSADYTVTRSGNIYTVSGADGTDTLKNIENLSFVDGLFAIDDFLL